MKSKIGIITLLLLITVGFAAVTTNLIANGQATIGASAEGLDVYFSAASTDAGGTAIISEDGKTITFGTKTLLNVGDVASLNYTVRNGSPDFDANVTVVWNINSVVDGKDYSDYYTVERTGFTSNVETLVESNESVDGTIVITLVQPVTENVQLSFGFSLNALAVEISSGGGSSEPTICNLAENDCLSDINIGDEVKIGDEHFYYIGNYTNSGGMSYKFIAKYNLGVGTGFNPPTNKQEETADGDLGLEYFQPVQMAGILNPDTLEMEEQVSPQQIGYWHNKTTNTIKSEYGTSYPAYVYDSNSTLYEHIENYVAYLSTFINEDLSGRLIRLDEKETLDNLDPIFRAKIYNRNYWTGTATMTNPSSAVLGMPKTTEGRTGVSTIILPNRSGVRPVIEIGIYK